jgi:hypothetical protein
MRGFCQCSSYSLLGHKSFKKAVCMKPGSLYPSAFAGLPAVSQTSSNHSVLSSDEKQAYVPTLLVSAILLGMHNNNNLNDFIKKQKK